MFIFRMVRRLVLIICIVLGAIYVYDTYQSYQGTNRVSKAHTTVEQTIEENEDTLSRWERYAFVFLPSEKRLKPRFINVCQGIKWVKSEKHSRQCENVLLWPLKINAN